MLKHIINIFRVNIGLKVISVVIAFILWLVVVNVSNPEVTDAVTIDIDVNYADEMTNAGKSFTLDNRTVRVSYRVRTNQRSQIHPANFDAYVDMRDYSVTGAVPIYVTYDSSVSNLISGVTQQPMVVHVTTEDMQEKQFNVSTRLSGSTAEGYVTGTPVLTPSTVSLYGPESEIGKVSRVGIVIDVEGAESTQTGTGRIQYFDANDNVIALGDKVTISSDVQYTVPVYKTKSVSINIPTTGQPASGYTLTGVESEPRFVQVYGEDAVLNRYNTIYLPEGLLDISGVNTNVTISLALQNYLPEGLYMVQSSDVTVVARIARQTDLMPGMANLPAATIQAPPAQQHPETTAAPAETTAHSEESAEHTESTEAAGETETAAHEETTAHSGDTAHETAGSESSEGTETVVHSGSAEGSAESGSDVVIHYGTGTDGGSSDGTAHEASGGEGAEGSAGEAAEGNEAAAAAGPGE